MWHDFFPLASIYGIDNSAAHTLIKDRVQCFVGEQQDSAFLATVIEETGPLDIVIDDGSHYADDQIASFECLWPAVHSGGWYCIEDYSLTLRRFNQNQYGILDLLSRKCTKIMLGRSPYAEMHLIGQGRKSGLIALRKR